ncbi:hypothetical protein GOP47_0026635 [Adiantum capillus-veneris]|nr:hypothetical protein GOP47_0026635 [Adiantum capillus-veneris]
MMGGASAAFVERITCYLQYDDNATSVVSANHDERVMLAEAPFTQGPSNTSRLLGRLQMAVFEQPYEDSVISVAQIFTATFDSTLYRGVIAILGQQLLKPRGFELAVVGGTGRFRLARGFVIVRASPVVDNESYYARMEFNLYR